MKDYNKIMNTNPEIIKKLDNFNADFYFIPASIRGRNKTRIFNTLIKRGWKQEANPEYLSYEGFYAHNHSRIGIIIE